MLKRVVERVPLSPGTKFSRWTALSRAEDSILKGKTERAFPVYLCVCECGNFNLVRRQSLLNVRKRKDNTTGRTGVYLDSATGKYFVQLQSNKITYKDGPFLAFEDAVSAREALELKYHGRIRPSSYESEGEYY